MAIPSGSHYFHEAVFADERFRAGDVNTGFLEHFDWRQPESVAAS